MLRKIVFMEILQNLHETFKSASEFWKSCWNSKKICKRSEKSLKIMGILIKQSEEFWNYSEEFQIMLYFSTNFKYTYSCKESFGFVKKKSNEFWRFCEKFWKKTSNYWKLKPLLFCENVTGLYSIFVWSFYFKHFSWNFNLINWFAIS